jgi:enoyl-CoA hydratase/carnithine racemase
VRALADKVADASAVTLRIGKEAFYRQVDLPEDAAYEQMSDTMATNAMTCDAQEGMSAFLAKRAPHWQHR